MGQKLQAPRGTRGSYPADMRPRDWLVRHIRDVARAHVNLALGPA